MKKLLVLVVMLSMFVNIAFSNSQNEAPVSVDGKTPIRLYTYYADTDVQVVDYAVERLEAKYPVKIEVIHRADATGIELKTMAAVGKLPDIFEVTGETVINTFLKSGDIQPLDSAMEKYGANKDIVKATLDYLKNADGHTYAINFEPPRNFLIFSNDSVFKKFGIKRPTNYDELLAATKVLVANEIIPFSLFGAEPWPGIMLFDSLASRYNPAGVKGLMNGSAKITDAGYVKAANQLVELVNAGFIGRSSFATNASQAFELFKTGKSAMIGNGTWYLLDIASYGEGYSYLDNPFSEAGKEAKTLMNRVGGSAQGGWTINPKGVNAELASEIVIEYGKLRNEASVKLFGAASALTYDVQPDVARHPAAQKFADEIKDFKTTTFFPWNFPNPEIASAFNDNNQALLAGALTAEEFISDMAEVIKNNQ